VVHTGSLRVRRPSTVGARAAHLVGQRPCDSGVGNPPGLPAAARRDTAPIGASGFDGESYSRPVYVREADAADVDRLARLRAAWRSQPLSAEFLAAFQGWFLREESSRWWWVAIRDGDSVGMVNVKLFDRMPSPDRPASRWGYLANLFVLPDNRGAGVGASLIAAVVDRARAEGLARLVVSPAEMSTPLYRRHGFRPAMDLLLMPLADDM
jgi:GNAT superfamily N-acetyltransferase